MADIYLHLNGEQKGPFSAEQVRAMLASGEVTPETLAWRQGLTEWSKVAVLLGAPAAPLPGIPSVPQPPVKDPRPMSGWLIALIVCACLMVLCIPCCCGLGLGPINAGIKMAKESAAVQQARAIELAMSRYAMDHNGAYPDGERSTEVFQKLLDGQYVKDPGLFYIKMPGKLKAQSTTLTALNVSFDVTSGVTSASPDNLPVVYSTGYFIIYSPGIAASRNLSSATPFSGPVAKFAGMAVAYKDGSARFLHADTDGENQRSEIPGTTIRQFLPPDFDAKGQVYAQLRP